MAWQSQSAMAGMGGMPVAMGDGPSNGGHPQGTEYTLQGRCLCAREPPEFLLTLQ